MRAGGGREGGGQAAASTLPADSALSFANVVYGASLSLLVQGVRAQNAESWPLTLPPLPLPRRWLRRSGTRRQPSALLMRLLFFWLLPLLHPLMLLPPRPQSACPGRRAPASARRRLWQ